MRTVREAGPYQWRAGVVAPHMRPPCMTALQAHLRKNLTAAIQIFGWLPFFFLTSPRPYIYNKYLVYYNNKESIRSQL